MRAVPVVLVALVVVGCASPVLEIAEPSEEHKETADFALERVVLEPSRRTPPWEMKAALGRVLGPIRHAAFAVCLDEIGYDAGKCGRVLPARVNLYSAETGINAYADQWNNIGVLGGLVAEMGSDEELAGVLAHEYAHILLGHVGKKIKNALAGAALAGGVAAWSQSYSRNYNPQVVHSAMQLGAMVGSRAYSKQMEIEADRVGVYILKAAGYDPYGMGDAILRLSRAKPKGTRFLGLLPARIGFLQTHPNYDRRIAHILSAIEDAKAEKRLKLAGEGGAP